jgi:hypothetical protein
MPILSRRAKAFAFAAVLCLGASRVAAAQTADTASIQQVSATVYTLS